MFGKLKERLKGALDIFSRKAEEDAEIKAAGKEETEEKKSEKEPAVEKKEKFEETKKEAKKPETAIDKEKETRQESSKSSDKVRDKEAQNKEADESDEPKSKATKPPRDEAKNLHKYEYKDGKVPKNTVKITYFVHGTTTDNELGLCTGWAQGELSASGVRQAKELKNIISDLNFDAVFSSDLKRAVDSVKLGFSGKDINFKQDKRLRECNYGEYTQKAESEVDYRQRIDVPFQGGESLKDVEKRIADFLNELYEKFKGKHIAIMAHRAPQLAIEVLLERKTWEQAIKEDWRSRKAWQPGWIYFIKEKVKSEPSKQELPKEESPKSPKEESPKDKLPKEEFSKEEPHNGEKKHFFRKLFSRREETTKEVKDKEADREAGKEAGKEASKETGKEAGKETPKSEAKDKEKEGGKDEEKGFIAKVTETFTTRTISAEKFEKLFWDLELVLLENNVSVEVIEKIKKNLISELVDKPLPRDIFGKISDTLRETLSEILSLETVDLIEKIEEANKTNKNKPFVIAFFGINGTGKTTSIAKLAHYLKKKNKSVVFAACDTFRAAAIDQLQEHADRLKVKMIRHDYGSDAAAVAYDAIRYAEKNKIDVVMIDTAGRLHSNTNLMAELEKIIRVTKPDFRIFVGESITGNDCIEQARRFNELVEMDGVILTKADVDEKGGAPLSISYTIKKPILFLGIGQGYDDLEKFDTEVILRKLGF